jgi:adenylate cyclase
VTARAVLTPLRPGTRRIRIAGAILLAGSVLLTVLRAPWTVALQSAWFDLHQMLWPRTPTTLPVTVVEIDARSLQSLGPWPWPRKTIAQLVDGIAANGPAALGLDLLMPEVDVLSPEHLLTQAVFDDALVAALQALPSNDAALGDAVRRARAVLAVAGLPEPRDHTLRSAPVTVQQARVGHDGALDVVRHPAVQTSIDLLDRQAGGWGLTSVGATQGVVQRMPLVASVGTTLVPALSVELLRVAMGETGLILSADGPVVRHLQVGRLVVRTEADGSVRPWFSARDPRRYISAVDLFQGKAEAAALKGQIVIVGPTAVGLEDFRDTPLGQRMPGSELHAQLIENLLGDTLLYRPRWATTAEAVLLLVLGALLLWIVPKSRPWRSALLLLGLVTGAVLAGVGLFLGQRWLIDTASPSLGLLLLFIVLLMMSLTESSRQRRLLEGTVQAQREQAARVAGELEAAQRIQRGSLPRADLLRHETRAELHAVLVPAREVGGDLYDYFMLDERRLFVLIGDVSGKGLPASIFMAVSKALYKAAMLRAPTADVGSVMAAANAELSRDNTEQLFVTAFAAILDLDEGTLSYCNAGHDNPYLLRAGQPLRRIEDGDGPPLCAVDDFDYRSAAIQLRPGDLLCLMTDGVTDASNRAGAQYGNARLQQLLGTLHAAAPTSSRDVVEAIHGDVSRFAAGAEAADDLTLLALRWTGRPDATVDTTAVAAAEGAACFAGPARMEQLTPLHDFVAAWGERSAIDRSALLRVQLLLEELFSNTVRHGHGGASDAPVRVLLRREGADIEIVYEDSGPPFDTVAAGRAATATSGERAQALDIGGVGLQLIVEMAAATRYERRPDGNTLRLRLTARP